ncbi:MAG TPA: Sec-independent protein translocase subunit TatA [Phycicoccus sp.]|nr:Sec-independent protein translocase subunit TatA [Phycicoccus sp.]
MGALKGWHIVIIVVAFLILFGFKRLPDAARSLGRSMRIFKSEVDEMKAESEAKAAKGVVEGEIAEGSPTATTSTSADAPKHTA